MEKSKSITIVDTTIPIVEYQGQRVVTLDMIDKLHHRPDGTASRNFTANKERFEEGKHFYLIDYSKNNEFRCFGIEVPPRGMTLVTERGYSMLVKSFSDDFAWEVQEQLSDSYFDNSQPMSTAEFLVQQANLMLEYENRFKKIEQRQTNTEVMVAETRQDVRVAHEKANEAFEAAAAALQHKFGRPDYFTIMAYASIAGVSVDINAAKLMGSRASQLSREQDKAIIRVPDERFGKVNSYHESILKIVFGDAVKK